MRYQLWFLCFILGGPASFAQIPKGYWQQQVEYLMDVDFNVQKHQFTGTQRIKYTNNSPDVLQKVFYHLYYNAFQPGSMMDVRSRTIEDADRRVMDRIHKLAENEQGWHRIKSLTCNGQAVSFTVEGTVLEAQLVEGIKPGKSAVFEMEFESQVPLQIRRTGRDNAEGIAYSMTQWYPKMVEYDSDGWHTNPYVGREFYGVWGRFDVTIHIDSSYTLGGTGVLVNPEQVGHGYQTPSDKLKLPDGEKLSWHFVAENVHDFAWAADPDYKHDVLRLESGLEVHYLYQTDTLQSNWDSLKKDTEKIFAVLNSTFGEYPYKQFSFIQGGDGGMEYPMSTLVVGHKPYAGFQSTCVHELIHSWYYGVLGTNESKYAWMDEGFTIFAQHYLLNRLLAKPKDDYMKRARYVYQRLVDDGVEEPLATHADHYHTNFGYAAVYYKGGLFLSQLKYIVGEKAFFQIMKQYYEHWQFKHPRPEDFKSVAEHVSGVELDWYFEHWIHTVKTIDYGLAWVRGVADSTEICLENKGQMPMPAEVDVLLADSTVHTYYIPLRIMRGHKNDTRINQLEDWPWTYPMYTFTVPFKESEILSITLDPRSETADVDRSNNRLPVNDRIYKGKLVKQAE